MGLFRPDIPPHVAEIVRRLPPDVKRNVKQALRALCENPDAGEPLRRELKGLRRYRVRRFRIVYAIDRTRRILQVFAVGHRREVYEEMVEVLRRRKGSRGER